MTPPGAVAARRFRNLQCNIQQTDPTAQAVSHVHTVAHRADLIGWNEAGTEAIRRSIARLPGFTSFIPKGSAGSLAISWRNDVFELVDTGVVKVHSGVQGVTPSRFIVKVRLRHRRSGIVFTRANTHVVHHIERAGVARTRATGAIPGQQNRARLHFKKMHELLGRWQKRGPVIMGGDFNVCYFADRRAKPRTFYFPVNLLGQVGRFAMPRHGTHGSRCIDYTVLGGRVHSRETRILPRGTSDHNPVLSMIELGQQ